MTKRIELFSLFIEKREHSKELKPNQIRFERMKNYYTGEVTDFKIRPVFDAYEVSLMYLIPFRYLETDEAYFDDILRLKFKKAKTVIELNSIDSFLIDLHDCTINDYDLLGDDVLSVTATCCVGLNRITKIKGTEK